MTAAPTRTPHNLSPLPFLWISVAILLVLAWSFGRKRAELQKWVAPPGATPATGEDLEGRLEGTARATSVLDQSPFDLIGQLRRIGAADSTAPQHLEPLLGPIIGDPGRVEDVLAHLVGGAFLTDMDPEQLARLGALRSLLAALAVFAVAPVAELPRLTPRHSERLIDALLGALPALELEDREALTIGLIGLEVDGEPVIGVP